MKLGEDPTRFLSTIQIGITSIGILSGIVGEAALAVPLSLWMQELGFEQRFSDIGSTVLVVAGTGATAVAADLGSRTIRDEISALEVLGLDPATHLVLPRALASALVAATLNAAVCAIGLAGGFVFSVYLNQVDPGAFAAGVTLLVGPAELILSEVKAALFGLIAGLVACYRGLAVAGGPKSVGDAVNETVVFSFVALFLANLVLTAIGIQVTGR